MRTTDTPWATSQPEEEIPCELPGDAIVTLCMGGVSYLITEMKPDGDDALVKLEDGRCLRLKNVQFKEVRMTNGQ